MRLRFRIRATASPPGQVSTGSTPIERTVDIDGAASEIQFGRQHGVQVQLPFAAISGLHARLSRQGVSWTITDLGSANGTWVGTTRLTALAPRPLVPGDTFRLADVQVTFTQAISEGADPAGGTVESTATIARRLVNDLFRGGGGADVARIVVDSGPTTGQAIALSTADRPYRAGRGADCEIRLPDEDVSREHASFRRSWEGVVVSDLGSKNGVTISGERVQGTRRMRDGETATVGATRLRLDDPEDRYLREIQKPQQAQPARPVSKPAAAVALPPTIQPPARKWSAMPGVLAALAMVVLLGVLGLAAWLVLGH